MKLKASRRPRYRADAATPTLPAPSAGFRTLRPWLQVRAATEEQPTEILIYGQIGRDWYDAQGVEAREFLLELNQVPRNQEIVVGINSPGGEVMAGMAIYTALQQRRNRVVCRVDGHAASIASIIALAGRETQMPDNAWMMIHDPSGLVMGTAEDARRMAEDLDRMGNQMATIYANKAGGTVAHWRGQMLEETWFTGTEAYQAGLSDRMLEPAEMVASFQYPWARHVPATLYTFGARQPASEHPMNRQRTLALLRRMGITANANAQDSVLRAHLQALLSEERITQEEFQACAGTPPPAPPQDAPPQGNAPGAPPQNRPAASPQDPPPQGNAPAAPPPTAPAAGQPAAPSATDSRIATLEARLNEERTLRLTRELEGVHANNPAIVVAEWLPRVLADQGLLPVLASLQPAHPPGMDPVRPRAQHLGDPLLAEYERLPVGRERAGFRMQHFAALGAARVRGNPQAAGNTLAAGLVVDWLADGLVVTLTNILSPLRAFSRDFGVNPLAPRSDVKVRKATANGTAQKNPTNFEVGDSVLDVIPVTVDQYNRSYHITNNELQSGHRMMHLAEANAQVFANSLSDAWTVLLKSTNFSKVADVGAAEDFGAEDLKPIRSAAKDLPTKNLVMDGAYTSYLLPTDRQQFRLGEQGAFNFDLIAEQNRWTDADDGVVGLCASPNGLAVASGLPVQPPAGEFLTLQNVTLEQLGLTVQVCSWYSRQGRVNWASYDVMFGAAAGDGGALVLLQSYGS